MVSNTSEETPPKQAPIFSEPSVETKGLARRQGRGNSAFIGHTGFEAAQLDRLETYEESVLPKRGMSRRELDDVLRSTRVTGVTVATAKQQIKTKEKVWSLSNNRPVLECSNLGIKTLGQCDIKQERVTRDGSGEIKKSITETLNGASDSSFLASTTRM